jgi:DNA invertase Pin-like site-specific DNA recombinase
LSNKRSVGLIRGSTVEQLNTLLVQENTIRAYAQAKGFELLELFTDSGTSAEKVPFFQRERAQEALAKLKDAGAYHILVTKTDRAFRNHEDCIVTCRVLWDDFGISVHFIDEGLVSSSEKDSMVLQIRASVAEEENRRRRDRQLGAFFVMRASHERCGQFAPYGWTVDPERHRTTRRGTKSDYLLPEPIEQRGLQRLFELMQATGSTSKTARILNAEGISPRGAPRYLKGGEKIPSAGKWHPATVQSALEHGILKDGTHCVVENRGGRLHFDFIVQTAKPEGSTIAA